jgi:hypothetical protein
MGVLAALVIGAALFATSGTASADCPGCTNNAVMTANNLAEVAQAPIAQTGDTNVRYSAYVIAVGGDAEAEAVSILKQKNLQFLIQANVGDLRIFD